MKKTKARSVEKKATRAYDRESHILIVDDDSSLLKFFKIHLNKFFSKVLVVETGKDALDAIKERPVDVVLTDIRMPKIDGLTLMAKIRKSHPEIPILLISGEPITDSAEKIVKAADGFLAKPFTVDELNDYINNGVDLCLAMKELTAILNNPAKIRAAMECNSESISKYVTKDSLPLARSSLEKIRTMKQGK